MTEQAKFSYSPLVKAFEKQTKTIEDQGEKQIKAIQDKRPIKSIDNFTDEINDNSMILKEKGICNKLTEERFEKLGTDKLLFKYKGNTADQDFSRFDNVLDLIDKKRNGEISLTEAKDEQAKLKSYMGEIKRVQKKKEEKQKQILKIFTM